MLVLGVAAIVELGSVDNRTQYLGTHSVPAAQTVGTIETPAANVRRVQADPVVARAARRPQLMRQLAPYAAEAPRRRSWPPRPRAYGRLVAQFRL